MLRGWGAAAGGGAGLCPPPPPSPLGALAAPAQPHSSEERGVQLRASCSLSWRRRPGPPTPRCFLRVLQGRGQRQRPRRGAPPPGLSYGWGPSPTDSVV